MNKVILIGRLTRDPEARATQNTTNISKFTLACDSGHTKDGEKITEFINCVAFNKLAETINKYCKKGSLVGVQGRIKNSNYEAQDGTKRYSTDIVVEQLEFLSSSKGNDSQSGAENSSQNNNVVQSDPYAEFAEEYTLNPDDLPF